MPSTLGPLAFLPRAVLAGLSNLSTSISTFSGQHKSQSAQIGCIRVCVEVATDQTAQVQAPYRQARSCCRPRRCGTARNYPRSFFESREPETCSFFRGDLLDRACSEFLLDLCLRIGGRWWLFWHPTAYSDRNGSQNMMPPQRYFCCCPC